MDIDEVEFILEDPDMVKEIVTAHLVGFKPEPYEYTHNNKNIKEHKCGRCKRWVYNEYLYCTKCGGLILW